MRHGQSRGGRQKTQTGGNFNLLLHKYYITVFVTIKCSKTHLQPFVLFVICYYLVVTGHCCQSMTHKPGFYPGMFWEKFPPKNLQLPPPKNFCHVGNYNLNIEAKSNGNYSTGICYLLCEVFCFFDKCTKSPNFSNIHGFNKLHVSNRNQTTSIFMQRNLLQYHKGTHVSHTVDQQVHTRRTST